MHVARSWTIDPHTFRDWYGQTVRWSCGQFQSVRGHRLGLPVRRDATSRLGVRFSWFDLAYLALLVDWPPYMLEPVAIVLVAYFLRGWIDPRWLGLFYLASSFAWLCIAAFALRKPRLIVLFPAILLLDIVYRATMLHAAVKTVRQPRAERCQWDSPTRFELANPASTNALTARGSVTVL